MLSAAAPTSSSAFEQRPSKSSRAALILASFCLGLGCAGSDARLIERDVGLLVGEPGPITDAAEERLLSRGHAAILYLETGLYNASEIGRRRVIKVLRRIGHREAFPILRHLAKNDDSAEVREDAARALVTLKAPANSI